MTPPSTRRLGLPRRLPRAAAALVILAAGACVAEGPDAGATPPPGTACSVFPDNNVWHADIRSLPKHPRSAEWIAAMGGKSRRLHPDFGPSDGPQPYGIPFGVVDATHEKVSVEFLYEDESDPGPYPFGPHATIEAGSDRHALMVHADECVLYELFDADWNGGRPTAGSGAIFDLSSNKLRPRGWTSADAAGLPILAGLIRRDEVEAGVIDHAIRVTVSRTNQRFIWPARHQAGAAADRSLPPMGARFRLKKGFDISGFLPETRVILKAMKKHGLIVADNGSDWFFGGASEEGWSEEVLDELKSIKGGKFVAVKSGLMKVHPDSGRVKPSYAGL